MEKVTIKTKICSKSGQVDSVFEVETTLGIEQISKIIKKSLYDARCLKLCDVSMFVRERDLKGGWQ